MGCTAVLWRGGISGGPGKGQITIPQAIRGHEAVQRLQQARLRTKLCTDQLLALTRGESEAGEQRRGPMPWWRTWSCTSETVAATDRRFQD